MTITPATDPVRGLNPPTLPDAGAVGYSQITTVEPGRLAFVSGQVAWGSGGERPPEGLEAQTRQVVSNLRAALEAVGAAPKDIAMLRCYMTDLRPETQDMVMPCLAELLQGAQPSLTGIGVAALATPDLQIEIEMVLRLPD
ncbi:RidA family protein [Pseudoroseicyclus aestuarii]|uniref:Enamine deaminase RidA (YjgF/YER057c/UK114 family) n=1 Tax=Pseudoroseicyclus aestuarii TaxID=1795041 RepID=A0A318T1P2_9RHOB|nr:RidA family protein [Pseudoroseicyclus aestuarii]PYE85897.1 enamine deaminase RidA (YjgF/YER057c/UK114 family) [Pseudoroseicyclus aestuarii]